MATRKTVKKAPPTVIVEPLRLNFPAKRAKKKATRKHEKLLNKRLFVRGGSGSLSAMSAKVETYAMSNNVDKPYFEAEASLALSDGANTIDLSFFASDKKAAKRELADLTALVKLVTQAREAFVNAIGKIPG